MSENKEEQDKDPRFPRYRASKHLPAVWLRRNVTPDFPIRRPNFLDTRDFHGIFHDRAFYIARQHTFHTDILPLLLSSMLKYSRFVREAAEDRRTWCRRFHRASTKTSDWPSKTNNERSSLAKKVLSLCPVALPIQYAKPIATMILSFRNWQDGRGRVDSCHAIVQILHSTIYFLIFRHSIFSLSVRLLLIFILQLWKREFESFDF